MLPRKYARRGELRLTPENPAHNYHEDKQTNKQREKEREKERERKRGKETEKYLQIFIPRYRISKIPKTFSFYSVAMRYAKTQE